MNRIPEHIAIIMDGNGRWATERGKDRSYGHQAAHRYIRSQYLHCGRKTGNQAHHTGPYTADDSSGQNTPLCGPVG